jgi:hypothetical protein
MKPSRILAAASTLGSTLALATAAPAAAEVRPICFPVAGGPDAVHWVDSFGAPRGGGTRAHEGQDLMGEKGTPLLSAVDGTVREIVHDNGRGNRVVVQDDDGWFYVYLHVNNDTPGTDDGMATYDQAFVAGLAVGDRVQRCQPIAYMGDSGNAESVGSHLHFEIHRPLEDPKADPTRSWAWSTATPINPADSLRAASVPDGDGGPVAAPATRWSPFDSAADLVERQYLDFYGRPPDPSGARYWTERLEAGQDTPATFIARLLAAPEFEARIAPVARLYWAYFDRIPDTEGLLHWIGETGAGAPLAEVSAAFAASAEFATTYGELDDEGFVELVYRNVLDREPDADGLAYWLALLADGEVSRGGVMAGFAQSPEYEAKLSDEVRVVLAYVAMLGRSPDPEGLEHWAARGAAALVPGFYTSAEYAARVS